MDLTFIDLKSAPPSNAFLNGDKVAAVEKTYPLRVKVCEKCWLVQTEDFADAYELFDPDYIYFSGFSSTWLAHCQRYVAHVTERFDLNENSHVVEVAANDGYLLQYVQARGIPCTGIEPTARTAEAAREKGIEIVQEFFGKTLGESLHTQGKAADVIAGNNVLAHVPDINDFVAGFSALLKPSGVITVEFPHLLNLIRLNQFDTIYHEHFSYLSLTAVRTVFAAHGLSIFDVQEFPTHGGSLRLFAQHTAYNEARPITDAVRELATREEKAGFCEVRGYEGLQVSADAARDGLLTFLAEQREAGRSVAAYGAAAKGNTLLNYCGIQADGGIDYVVDASPHKQGLFLPGNHIPVVCEDRIRETRPDFIIILPWNLRQEITTQLAYVREWGCQFVTCIPQLEIL